MVRLNKIYTRTGDAGQTGIVGGSRLPKSAPRMAAIGDVDELNSAIGVALTHDLPDDARAQNCDFLYRHESQFTVALDGSETREWMVEHRQLQSSIFDPQPSPNPDGSA